MGLQMLEFLTNQANFFKVDDFLERLLSTPCVNGHKNEFEAIQKFQNR